VWYCKVNPSAARFVSLDRYAKTKSNVNLAFIIPHPLHFDQGLQRTNIDTYLYVKVTKRRTTPACQAIPDVQIVGIHLGKKEANL